MRTRQILHALVLAALVVSSQVTGAGAQTTWTVTTIADSGPGSLRAAITAANATVGPDTIVFGVSGIFGLSSTLPTITDALTIDGAGQSITISGNNTVRVMLNRSTLTLNALTITQGNCLSGNCWGGGVRNERGTLTVSNSTFLGNRAQRGGGISGDGTLTIRNSTFWQNVSPGGVGGAVLWEGLISQVTVTTSTFVYNSSGGGSGGAIALLDDVTATVTNVTFSENTGGSGGALYVDGSVRASLSLANSIVAGGNTSGNCSFPSGGFNDLGGNLSDDATCPFTQGSSVINTDPLLGPLQDNGGPTLTRALQPGSPAIDAGLDVLAQDAGLTTDQRGAGVARFVGERVDIGAFESDINPKFIPAAPLTLERGTVGGASVFIGTAVAGGSAAPVLNAGQVAGGTATGLMFGSPSLTSSGALVAVTPPVSCTQTSGTVRFEVTDRDGLTGEGDLQVNVVPSTVSACVCAVGSVGDGTTCTCLPGFFKPAGATSCRPADPGYYVSESGAAAQHACEVGKYQPNSGSMACLSADTGHYVSTLAAIAQLPCEPGKYQPNPGAASCVLASPGFYVPAPAATAQLACPVGTTSAAGASACYPMAPVFPATGVLDTFNRANGAVGSQWSIATSTLNYRIAGNRLDVLLGGPILWQPTAFGPSQEAFVTLAAVDTRSPSQGVLLKVQTGSVPDAGAISVVYDALAQRVRVSTLRTAVPVWQPYAGIAATFIAGDRLGARARANGTVEVYKNGTRLATVTLSSSDQAFFNGKGGRIGLWTLAAPAAFFDDFGGGTIVP